MAKLSAKLLHKISQLLFVQAILTVVSTPFLIAWGLPIALLGPIGNLIFTPFLLIFLALACLITICELCCLPDQILIKLLENLTDSWLWLTQWGPKNSLLGLPQTAVPYFSIIALGTVLLMLLTTKVQFKKILLGSLGLMALGCIYFTYGPDQPARTLIITHQNYQLEVLYCAHKIYLVDRTRLLAHVADPVRWCERVLRPQLTQQFGNAPIVELQLVKPTERIKKLLPELQVALGIVAR